MLLISIIGMIISRRREDKGTMIVILIITSVMIMLTSIKDMTIIGGLFKTESLMRIPVMGKSIVYISKVSIYIIIVTIIIKRISRERGEREYKGEKIIILFTILRNAVINK